MKYLLSLNGSGENALDDPFLTIFGDNGQFAEDDDGGPAKASEIYFTPERSQYYDIVASQGGVSGGDFVLNVLEDDYGNRPGGSAPVGALRTSGRSQTGEVNYEGDVDPFAIQLVRGLVYNLSMVRRSGDADGDGEVLRLYDADGALVATDADSGREADALIVHRAKATGDYWLYAGSSGDATFGYRIAASVGRGSTADERIVGTDGGDSINVLAGDDRVDGAGGADDVSGASGDDTLDGGDGRDELYGGAGRDVLFGGLVRDRLFGGEHRDRLFGGDGGDAASGGAGNDRLVGGAGGDVLNGEQGLDTIYGGDARD